jgi:hypothetical protein
MPRISAFYGIVITMYFRDHPLPHFHAFAGSPPLTIALPFLIHRSGPSLSTVLGATAPPALGNLPHLSRFGLRLFRLFRRYRGIPRLGSDSVTDMPAWDGLRLV